MRLDFNTREQARLAKADKLEAAAKALRENAHASKAERSRARPLVDRLTFAAFDRCICGHGMAYDPDADPRPTKWECSAILLDIADKKLMHQAALPFAFYEVKGENQPSSGGRSTRTPAEPRPEAFSAEAAA